MSFTPIFKTKGFFKLHEPYQSRHAIVFLTVNPDPRLFTFAEKLASDMYHVYFSIDSDTYVPPPISSPFITVLNISRSESEKKGYRDSVLWVNGASSRCKALYYFCEKNTISYEAIWFTEDDVFIPSVNTLKHLDMLYSSSETDLLSTVYHTAHTDNNEWQFPRNRGRIDLPWAGGAIMAIRVSPRMIDAIRTFMSKNTTLLMDELLFHTLALHANLTITVAPELKALVVFRHSWTEDDTIQENRLFHPMKSYQEQLDTASKHGFEHYTNI